MSVPVITAPFTFAVAVRTLGSCCSNITMSAGNPKGLVAAPASCPPSWAVCWAWAATGSSAIASAAVVLRIFEKMLSVT